MVIQDDLFDDNAVQIPCEDVSTNFKLRKRFEKRLSQLLWNDVTIRENGRHLIVYASPWQPLDKNYIRNSAVKSLFEVMNRATGSHSDLRQQNDFELRNALLSFYQDSIDADFNELVDVFKKHAEIFIELTTQYFGAMDENPSAIDEEMVRFIIKLQEQTNKEGQRVVVELAREMAQVLPQLEQRLRGAINRSKISETLFRCICNLGAPQRFLDTLTRMRKSFSIEFKLETLAVRATMNSSRPLAKFSSNRKKYSYQAFTAQPSVPNFEPNPGFSEVQMFLHEEDRKTGLLQIKPMIKREAISLLQNVFRNKIPKPEDDTFLDFGFVTCKTRRQAGYLGGLYYKLFQEGERETILDNVWRAVENGNLVRLLDAHEWGHFREFFPALENFLNTPKTHRPTVWRLIQFIRADNATDPPPCLRRDYGFKYCKQREDVINLKKIYYDVLEHSNPMELHTACVWGRLLEFGMNKCTQFNENHRRLMQNDFPRPSLGFDDGKPIPGHEGPLFKRS